MTRPGKLERKLDAMTDAAEMDIEAIYDEALIRGFRVYKQSLSKMREIMDGTQKPPRWCITSAQKERWKQKALAKLLNESQIDTGLGNILAIAGEASVSRIKRFGLDAFKTAYKGAMDKLRG